PRPALLHLVLGVVEPGFGAPQVPLLHGGVRHPPVPPGELFAGQLGLGPDDVLLAVADGLLPEGLLLGEPVEPPADFQLAAGDSLGRLVPVLGQGGQPVPQGGDGADVRAGGHGATAAGGILRSVPPCGAGTGCAGWPPRRTARGPSWCPRTPGGSGRAPGP